MEPEGSLPHLQVPATCPYPEPARSSAHPLISLTKIHLNIIFPSKPGSPKWSLSFRFPPEILYTLSSHPYALHAPPISLFNQLLLRKLRSPFSSFWTAQDCRFDIAYPRHSEYFSSSIFFVIHSNFHTLAKTTLSSSFFSSTTFYIRSCTKLKFMSRYNLVPNTGKK